jgi:hypothetical protein
LLLSERQAAEEARKAHADGEARNSELAKKLEDAAKKMDQLQESVQRFVNASWSGTGWILVLMPYDRIVCMPLMISLSLIKLMQSFRFLVCLLDISLHNFTLVMRYLCLQVGTFLIAYSHPFDFTCVRALHAHMFPPPLPLSRFFFFLLYTLKVHLYCRLEEKLSNSESENQVLRQQALTMSPTGKSLSARPKSMIIQVEMEFSSVLCHNIVI